MCIIYWNFKETSSIYEFKLNVWISLGLVMLPFLTWTLKCMIQSFRSLQEAFTKHSWQNSQTVSRAIMEYQPLPQKCLGLSIKAAAIWLLGWFVTLNSKPGSGSSRPSLIKENWCSWSDTKWVDESWCSGFGEARSHVLLFLELLAVVRDVGLVLNWVAIRLWQHNTPLCCHNLIALSWPYAVWAASFRYPITLGRSHAHRACIH